jgi:hypothetical protein
VDRDEVVHMRMGDGGVNTRGMAQFERFSHDQVALKRDPWVTIQKRGTVSLNRSAYVALGSPSAAELLYDTESQIVGLRECDPHDRDAVHFRSPTGKDAGPFLLSAMAYLRFYGIAVVGSRRWLAYLEDGVLCVDLRAPSLPVTSNRARQITHSE